MKLTAKIIDQADTIIRIRSMRQIPLKNIGLIIATAMIRDCGFYTFLNKDTGKRVLIVQA